MTTESQQVDDFFTRQTDLDPSNASVPYIAFSKFQFNADFFTPIEVESVLNAQ